MHPSKQAKAAIVPLLEQALDHSDSRVVAAGASALGRVGAAGPVQSKLRLGLC